MSKVSCLFYRKLDKCFAEHVIKIHDMIIKMNEINEIFKFVIHKGQSLEYRNRLQSIKYFTIYPCSATSMP